MKKFLALFLCVLYLMSTNICYAFEELYYLKNVDKNTITSQIQEVLADKDFDIKNQNPIHAVSQKNSENFAIIVLQQSGENLFYYYESNDKNKKLNKNIIKAFKKNDIVYEQSENAMLLQNFSDIVYRYNTGTKKVYSFEEPKQNQDVKTTQQQKQTQPTTRKCYVKKKKKGVKLNVYLQNGINTANATQGDAVNAVLKEPWTYKEYTVAPQGSVLTGTVVKASAAKLGSRNGYVDIVFNKILTPDGKTIDISTEKVEFNVTNEGKVKQVLGSTVAMAAVGALVGLGIAAMTGDSSDLAKGAIIGASIGGGGALATNVAQKGIDAEIPAYTDIELVLDKPTSVVLSY